MEDTIAYDASSEPRAPRAVDVLPGPTYNPRRRLIARRAVPAQSTAPAQEQLAEAPVAEVPDSELIPAQSEPVSDPGVASHTPIERDGLLQHIAAAIATDRPHVFAQFGLDDFRSLNAAVGPVAGDAALHRVGVILSWVFRDLPMARIGSDCFGVLLPYDGLPDAKAQVERALTLIATNDLSADGIGVRATASAGITILDRPGLTAAGAALEADLAMAAAKSTGRNNYSVHDVTSTSEPTAVHAGAARIRHALDTDGFILHAQPVRSLRGDTDQWELLVRLAADDGELVSQADFLPVAERFGLMHRVDEWVTKQAVRIIAEHAAVGQLVRLEVNLAESTLGNQSFAGMVEDQLRATGIEASCLVFEVNSAAAAANIDHVATFAARLRELGCLFALDAFGSSTGDLHHVKALPLDFVKIDGSFVRQLPASVPDQFIVRSLSDLAHSLGCRVVAMSVSDDETQALLDQIGVDYVQGVHVGRPEPLVAQ